MQIVEASNRLHSLVSQRVPGARIRQFHAVDHMPNETHFIVLWERDGEFGTHRAMLGNGPGVLDGQADLLWGHFHRGPNRLVAAYKDYHARIAPGA